MYFTNSVSYYPCMYIYDKNHIINNYYTDSNSQFLFCWDCLEISTPKSDIISIPLPVTGKQNFCTGVCSVCKMNSKRKTLLCCWECKSTFHWNCCKNGKEKEEISIKEENIDGNCPIL